MRKLTLRHQIELLVLAVDNRPVGNISATYTLARINLHFTTFLTILVTIAGFIGAIQQDIAWVRLRLVDFAAWLNTVRIYVRVPEAVGAWLTALNPLSWTMDDLRIIWEAATTLHLYWREVGNGAIP